MSRNESGSERRRTAGLGDIRVIIGGLLGIYGVILTIMGIAGSAASRANLWAGIALLVGCAAFLLWDFLSPTVLEGQDDTPASPPSGNAG